MAHTERIILLIDMDCFYCQVEENLDPALKGKPLAVVQYNQWRGGGIIAVNYLARERGVTRHMRGDDAKEKCPEIELVKVPNVRGKADLSKYREAGKRVADVLQTYTSCLERASVDEAYLDITSVVEKRIQDRNDQVSLSKLQNTFVVGSPTKDFIDSFSCNETNFKLALGGVIAEEIRAEVFKITGYHCSAGIAHNKVLAKLVCGLHKPNKQTILPHDAVPHLYGSTPVKKVRSLGGKFGNLVMEKLQIENMSELSQFTQKELASKFDEKSAVWLYNIARGIDTEPVNTRLISKSIGCCKKFPGKGALCHREDIEHWLNELADEIAERLDKDLEENNRRAKQMIVSYAQEIGGEEVSSTKTHPMNSQEKKKIFENAFKIIQKNCLRDEGCRVTFLGISAGQFQDVSKVKEITSYFDSMRQNKKRKLDQDAEGEIFSCATQEDEEDTRANLVFYEQIHPESVVNRFEVSGDSDSSHDSISTEVNSDNSAPPSASFFSSYFTQTRDFDTSKTIENGQEKVQNVCPQCGKTVGSADLQSHQDYHYALSIVKQEAHLYSDSSEKASSPVKASKKKRKKEGCNSAHKPIGDYFKSLNHEGKEDGKPCEECGRLVPADERDIHMDYHAAKRLHLEMNVKSGKPNNSKGQRNILGFLKSS